MSQLVGETASESGFIAGRIHRPNSNGFREQLDRTLLERGLVEERIEGPQGSCGCSRAKGRGEDAD
jgi:hypothetical protein